ncbi:MAG TPA: MMPL family transporter [Acidimicrobiales bacterium]|nr:MMPL family transporter [Acidimicrobiales bacterium]
MFSRLGNWCHDRRRLVLGLWVVALLVGGALRSSSAFRDEFNLPDSESKTGFDILDRHFGGMGTGLTGRIVFQARQGVDDPAVERAMQRLFERTARLDDVVRVVSPYSREGARQIAFQGPQAGRIAFAEVEMPDDIDFTRAGEIRDAVLRAVPDVEGLRVELGGFIFADIEEPSSETLGLAFAVVILILAFGSVLAMGLPVGTAVAGIAISTGIVTAASHLVTVPEMATFIGIMIGLGVGIDYALLIVTRYREQVHAGHSVREAVAIAMDTAGRSVLFAGTTVVISLLGMLLVGVTFVSGLALGAALAVAVTVAASLTLLPALLGFAGDRVERTRRRGLVAAVLVALGLVGVGLDVGPLAVAGFLLALVTLVAGSFVPSLRREVARRPPRPRRDTTAFRWSRLIQHRPWTFFLGGSVVLLVLAVPVLGLRLGTSDESNFPDDTTTKQAYDLLAAGFGPGFNGPLLLAAELPRGVEVPELAAVTEAVAADDEVALASPPLASEDGRAVIWQVVPASGPQEEETTDLVNRLRDDVLPPVERQVGVDVDVTGSVGVNIDVTDYLASRMPYFFTAVLGLSFLLLMVVFRSVLVPLKAVVMNMLSIAAAYGIVVALFQWGWLSDVTGVRPAPIEPWMPMMLFAIVFGLSMDYEVFLLSRIREEWNISSDSRASVADGLAATAKVITAAAAIMVFVFGSFFLEENRILKLMGSGLAVAVLLDATVVRLLLVPATMELLGDWNWWLPRWLDRILPDLDVEGPVEPAEGEGQAGEAPGDGHEGAGDRPRPGRAGSPAPTAGPPA